jgi:corrinoid protein of di/trimethylamine methyltransferase
MGKNGKHLRAVAKAVQRLDGAACQQAVEAALSAGSSPLDIIQRGLTPPLEHLGLQFQEGEIFIPQLVVAARIVQEASDRLLPLVPAQDRTGRVAVLGTVKGDIHDLGKNLVAALLSVSGFQVVDLGRDVATERFVEEVRDQEAHLVGLSALMTTTMVNQRRVIEALDEAGLRRDVRVMIGGAPVTQAWAQEIGADAYAVDAVAAVRLARSVCGVGAEEDTP